MERWCYDLTYRAPFGLVYQVHPITSITDTRRLHHGAYIKVFDMSWEADTPMDHSASERGTLKEYIEEAYRIHMSWA